MVRKLSEKYKALPIAAKATIWFVFCNALQRCLALITTPIFTRMMTTVQYGQYNIYNSWLQIFMIFTTLRLPFAVFNKGMSKYPYDRDGYTSTMQTITACLALILLFAYFIIRKPVNAFIELPTFIMVSIFAELIFFPSVDFWTIRKRYEYIYKPVVWVTLLMAFLNAIIGVIMVYYSEEKGYARILSCVIVNSLFGIILFAYNRRKSSTWFKKEYAVFAITFNLPLLLHYISLYILDQFDRIMIQKMVGMAAAGLYGVAYNAGLMIKILTQSINSALVPWQYGQLEKGKLKKIDDTLFGIFVFIAVCILMFVAFAPEIMMILADRKYYEARFVIPPVAVSTFFTFAYTVYANIEFYYDKNKFTMYVSMSGAALNIVLNYFGIKYFGYIAAAYTTLICYTIFTVAHFAYTYYLIKDKTNGSYCLETRRFIFLSIAIVVLSLSIALIYDYFIIRYIVIIIGILLIIIKRAKIMRLFMALKSRDS